MHAIDTINSIPFNNFENGSHVIEVITRSAFALTECLSASPRPSLDTFIKIGLETNCTLIRSEHKVRMLTMYTIEITII